MWIFRVPGLCRTLIVRLDRAIALRIALALMTVTSAAASAPSPPAAAMFAVTGLTI